MTEISNRFFQAEQSLNQSLDYIERMDNVFIKIFEIKLAEKARSVHSQIGAITGYVKWELWDDPGPFPTLPDSMDELSEKSKLLGKKVEELGQAIDEIKSIYKEFILQQAIVLLVSTLEVYLEEVFISVLIVRKGKSEVEAQNIKNKYGCFQNWFNAQKAFNNELSINIRVQKESYLKIKSLVAKRNVFVHNMGIIDEKYIENLNIPKSKINQPLEINRLDIEDGIEIIKKINNHIKILIERNETDI